MKRSIKHQGRQWVNCESRSRQMRVRYSSLFFVLLASTIALWGCRGSADIVPLVPPNLTLTGNWQFTMSPPTDGSFVGGLQGAYVSQNNGSVNGAATYSVSLTSFSIPCNRGSATMTGTVNGSAVQLTAVAGQQTFTLTGTLSLDRLTMSGNYNVTAGQAGDGSPCGSAQTGLQWSATLVPLLTGPIQGVFQSAGGASGLNNQQFAVSGVLTQQANTGSSSSVVSGNLTFVNFYTNTSPYPCLASAFVYGQISGTSVALEIVGSNESELGLIGEPVGSLGGTGLNTLTLNSTAQGNALQSGGASYLLASPSCPGALGSITTAGDYGTVCLALNNTTACQPPVAVTPTGVTFSSQFVGGPKSSQTITLTNNSSTILPGMTLVLQNESGATNFTETDLCGSGGVPSQGEPFAFNPGQICTAKVTFDPQETCAVGASHCPSPLTATLLIAIPSSNTIIPVPITGTASAQAASIPLFDFGGNGLKASGQLLISPGPLQIFKANRYMTEPLIFGDVKRDAETN